MKILIVSQHYWPENFRITEIAESLNTNGHDVTVVCGLPNYPKGFIFENYKNGKNRIEEHNGIHIIRAKEIGRRKGLFFRLLNYWSFPYFARKIVKKLDNSFDVVLVNELSPIMSATPGVVYAKKHKKPLVMYEMDLWPESLLAGGIKKESLIYSLFKKKSAKIYSKFDRIIVSTKEHKEYISQLPNCNGVKIDYLAQYADSVFEVNGSNNCDNGNLDLMFAGNIGKAQSIQTVIEAAFLLKEDKKIVFHIVGNGSELKNAQRHADALNLENIVFYGQKSLDEMPKIYSIADAMLVTLENKSYANITIPGKIQSYMASGKAIIGAVNGSAANFITNNKIGFCCEAANPEALASLIKQLDFGELKRIGKASREIYFSKYSKKIFISKLTEILENTMTKNFDSKNLNNLNEK